jgi:hypothetical protein
MSDHKECPQCSAKNLNEAGKCEKCDSVFGDTSHDNTALKQGSNHNVTGGESDAGTGAGSSAETPAAGGPPPVPTPAHGPPPPPQGAGTGATSSQKINQSGPPTPPQLADGGLPPPPPDFPMPEMEGADQDKNNYTIPIVIVSAVVFFALIGATVYYVFFQDGVEVAVAEEVEEGEVTDEDEATDEVNGDDGDDPDAPGGTPPGPGSGGTTPGPGSGGTTPGPGSGGTTPAPGNGTTDQRHAILSTRFSPHSGSVLQSGTPIHYNFNYNTEYRGDVHVVATPMRDGRAIANVTGNLSGNYPTGRGIGGGYFIIPDGRPVDNLRISMYPAFIVTPFTMLDRQDFFVDFRFQTATGPPDGSPPDLVPPDEDDPPPPDPFDEPDPTTDQYYVVVDQMRLIPNPPETLNFNDSVSVQVRVDTDIPTNKKFGVRVRPTYNRVHIISAKIFEGAMLPLTSGTAKFTIPHGPADVRVTGLTIEFFDLDTGARYGQVTHRSVDYTFTQDPAGCVACFEIRPSASVVVGDTVVFDASCSTGTGNLSYSWNFGDNTPETRRSSNPERSHTYSNAGQYNVTLRLWVEGSIADTKGLTVYVVPRDFPQACFRMIPESIIDQNSTIVTNDPAMAAVYVGEKVRFDPDCSSGAINSATWSIVNQTTGQTIYSKTHSITFVPYIPTNTFVFSEGGRYNVKLKVEDSGGNRHETIQQILVLDQR